MTDELRIEIDKADNAVALVELSNAITRIIPHTVFQYPTIICKGDTAVNMFAQLRPLLKEAAFKEQTVRLRDANSQKTN